MCFLHAVGSRAAKNRIALLLAGLMGLSSLCSCASKSDSEIVHHSWSTSASEEISSSFDSLLSDSTGALPLTSDSSTATASEEPDFTATVTEAMPDQPAVSDSSPATVPPATQNTPTTATSPHTEAPVTTAIPTQAVTPPPATARPVTAPPATARPITTPPLTTVEVTAPPVQTPAGGETLQLTALTSPVARGQKATVTIHGKPNTLYHISVYYSSGVSTAKGLEDAYTDGDGVLSWTWSVGNRTKAGDHKIVVTGGDESIQFYFTTTE